jgi:hypothetical protein
LDSVSAPDPTDAAALIKPDMTHTEHARVNTTIEAGRKVCVCYDLVCVCAKFKFFCADTKQQSLRLAAGGGPGVSEAAQRRPAKLKSVTKFRSLRKHTHALQRAVQGTRPAA